MRKLLLALLSIPAFATTYCLDATGGSDAASGKATGPLCTGTVSAWKTITKVNASSFLPGDSVLFKRGERFRGARLLIPSSGSSGNYITFGDYGSGALPIIDGSDVVTSWTLDTGSRYYATWTFASNTVFQNSSPLLKKASTAAMVNGSFFADTGASRLYVQTTTGASPTGFTIEASHYGPQFFGLIEGASKDWITIQNLDIVKSNYYGIQCTPCNNWVTRGNTYELSYQSDLQIEGQLGQAKPTNVDVLNSTFLTSGIGRAQGLEAECVAINLVGLQGGTIDSNTITGQAAEAIQTLGGAANLTIKNNTIVNPTYNCLYIGSGHGSGGTTSNITAYGNYCEQGANGLSQGYALASEYTINFANSASSSTTFTTQFPPFTLINQQPFVVSGTVPTGFTSGNTYYIGNISGNTFTLAATPGGTPITATSTVTGMTMTGSNDIDTVSFHNNVYKGKATALGGLLFGSNVYAGVIKNANVFDNTITNDGYGIIGAGPSSGVGNQFSNNLLNVVNVGSPGAAYSITDTNKANLAIGHDAMTSPDFATSIVVWGGVARTLATWRSTDNKGLTSVAAANPFFTNAGIGDYTLLSTSPAIGVGGVSLDAGAYAFSRIAITSPSGSPTWTGFAGNTFTASLTLAPSVARVCWTVDAYRATNPGNGALLTAGCSVTAPYSLPIDTFWWANGVHQVVATAYDPLGAVVSTSAPATFTIANVYPVVCSGSPPAFTVTPSTLDTLSWSGVVSITAVVSGPCATDNITARFWVDGVIATTATGTSGTFTRSIDTTRYKNGPHVVSVSLSDVTHFVVNQGSGAGDWSRTVNFSNSAVAMDVWNNAHDIYLAPSATFTIGCNLINTDETAVSPTCNYLSANTGVATVNSSGVITAVANGNTKVYAMAETITGTDLVRRNSVLFEMTSASTTFRFADTGRMVRIASGGPCTAGLYIITSVDEGNNFFYLDHSPGAQDITCGNFATGQTRYSNALVYTSNTTFPHIGTDGSILASYNAAKSFWMLSCFTCETWLTGQSYSPGPAADFYNTGWNTFSATAIYDNPINITNESAFHAAQQAVIDQYSGWLSAYPSLRIHLDGENFTRSGIWGATKGPPSQWSTPSNIVAWTLNAWKAIARVVGMYWLDEVNSSFGANPLAGPVMFGGGAQGGLNSIQATGGVCTLDSVANTFSFTFNGSTSDFIIRNSSVTNLNSVPGTTWHLTPTSGGDGAFPCAGVPNGTYNAGNDPNLVIEQYANNYTYASNTSYVSYTGFAQLGVFANQVSGIFPYSWPNASATSCESVREWEGASTQGPLLGIKPLSTYNDMYDDNTTSDGYLVNRGFSMNGLTDKNSSSVGGHTRAFYGCYDPINPLTIIGQGTSNYYGINGYLVAVTSLVDDLMITSVPHGVTNVIPGMTRLVYNGTKYYVIAAPTSTTLKLVLAAPTFTANATGGTATFADGSTLALTSIKTNTTVWPSPNAGDQIGFTYSGSISDTPHRKRCQTFTVSGQSGDGGAFSGKTFSYGCENLISSTDMKGTSTAGYNFFRQVPTGTVTGGTASITLDNSFVRGRQPGQDRSHPSPEFAFGSLVEGAVAGDSGSRVYKADAGFNGYMDHSTYNTNGIQGGFIQQAPEQITRFDADTMVVPLDSTARQLQVNPHFENEHSVPIFHALGVAGKLLNAPAIRPVYNQPKANPPDYGSVISCGARTGANGALLFCWNASDAPQTRTFTLTPYLQSGQQIIRYRGAYDGVGPVGIIAAATSTDTVTLAIGEAVFYVFPATFAGQLNQPTISARLADVPNATKIVVRYGYDLYNLDVPIANAYDCGSGVCTPPWDRGISGIWYRLIYLNSAGAQIAVSDVQTL